VASVASYFTWRWNRSRVVAASDRQARACSVQCDAIMPAFPCPPSHLPLRARVAELLVITLLVFASTDVALAQKKTVCTVTVNSADEKEAFRKALGPGQYDFVELVEHGRPDWLESACRRGVRCDVLVISGHYDGGNEFFSDRTEAREYLLREEGDKLLDQDQITAEALERVEQSGILFIDEIDKIAGRESGRGPDVSREGVQRDLLPIVEGTVVKTKHGMVRTDHIQFIAAGAFHVAKPSDLIPELQGRFPIRVELAALGREDLLRILTEPESSLVRQYQALLGTEGIELVFPEDGLEAIASIAEDVNRRTENIGARRLHTVMERVLEEVSFQGADLPDKRVLVDAAFVRDRLADIARDTDLSRFIL